MHREERFAAEIIPFLVFFYIPNMEILLSYHFPNERTYFTDREQCFSLLSSVLSPVLVWSNKGMTVSPVYIRIKKTKMGEGHMEICSSWILTMHVGQKHFNPNLLVTGTQLEETGEEREY